jgi:hypothetical protein
MFVQDFRTLAKYSLSITSKLAEKTVSMWKHEKSKRAF